jgi:hypothetical protein
MSPGGQFVLSPDSGKSLLAVSTALDYLASGGIPIIIEAQHFRGQISPALNREVALLGMASGRDLLSARRSYDRPLLCIVDGLQ